MAELNNKGQASIASHILLWIIAIGIIIWLVWSATHTNTTRTVNLAGSTPTETTVNKGFLSDLFEINFSCIPRGLINKTYNNGVNSAITSNKASS